MAICFIKQTQLEHRYAKQSKYTFIVIGQHYTFMQVEGILTGDITLSANMTLNGEPAHIIMLSYNKPAIFSMPG